MIVETVMAKQSTSSWWPYQLRSRRKSHCLPLMNQDEFRFWVRRKKKEKKENIRLFLEPSGRIRGTTSFESSSQTARRTLLPIKCIGEP